MKTLYKLLAIVMILGLAFTALPGKTVLAEPLENPEVWVCTSGDCGHPGYGYNTIQAGIDAVGSGGTVNVAAGTYTENILVNKAVTITGAGVDNSYIVATDGNKTPVTFGGSNAVVKGFTITHAYTEAELAAWNFNNNGVIFLQTTSGNTLQDCKVTLNRNGVYLNNSTNNTISGNIITDNRTGFNTTNTIDGTKILNNQILGNWTLGIVYYSQGQVTNFGTVEVKGNVFQNNWYSEVVIKDAGSSTGILDLNGNEFKDTPVTYTTSSATSLNEPGFTSQKPVLLGGTATPPVVDLPTLRIYNSSTVSLGYTGKTLMVSSNPGDYSTIQSAIDAASSGDTILVAAGTYAENPSITKSVTLLGPKAGVAVSGRTAFGSAEATIRGLITVNASNVTLNGFTLTNPSAAYAVSVSSSTTSLDILNNIVDTVGTTTSGLDVHAIILSNGPDNVYISGNSFNNLKAVGKSVSAIGVLDSASSNTSTDLLIENNVFTNITSASRGAYGVLINNKVGAPGAIIKQNSFSNLNGVWTHAIGLEGPTPGAAVTKNTFSALTAASIDVAAVMFEANPDGGSVDVSFNKFSTPDFYGVIIHPLNPGGAYTVDASPNWWGSPLGPTSAQVFGTVTTAPWCKDANCSETISDASGLLQSVIDAAPAGSTIIVPKGTYTVTGGNTLEKDGVTIILESGAVIQNSSPCFVINADNTRIVAEPGAKCIPTNGSNGIDVAAGITGVTVDGLEIDGSGQSTGDGIAFVDAVTDVVLVNNFIHNLDGDGISFAAEPAGDVDIHGNLFMNNAGNGIEAGTFAVPAEYNSWGSAAGAAAPAGDGISANVDAVPYTHVALSLVSSGAPWANQVVKGSTISYAVKANLVNVNAADFVLTYDATLLSLEDLVVGLDFVGLPTGSGTYADLVDGSVAGELHFRGVKLNKETVTGEVTLFTVTFKANEAGTSALNFDEATDEFGMPAVGSTENVYAAALTDGSVKVIDLPTLTTPDIRGYYLTGDARDFHWTVSNPALGGNFDWSIDYIFTITGAAKADVTSLVCPSFAGTTNLIPLFTESGGNLTGSMATIMGAIYPGFTGFPMEADTDYLNTCTITFAAAKSYPFTVAMVDMAADPDLTLVTMTETAVVFNKPVLSATGLTGSHQGLTVDFTLNINNMSTMTDPYLSLPVTFLVNLGLPAGTILKLPDNTSLCTSTGTGCSFSVDLIAGDNAIALRAVLPGTTLNFSVAAALYDSLATPDRLLQSTTFTGISVYDNIATLTGSVSMQGRSTRAGVPMTLTGATGFPYGPYTATSIEQISNNLIFSNVAEGTYTVSTNQPRYLNVAGISVEIKAGKVTLNRLELKGGNAKWTDNSIDILDAVLVGTTFGSTGSSYDGDVNFDGKVSIQDLALVGGNYGLTSAGAYGSWLP